MTNVFYNLGKVLPVSRTCRLPIVSDTRNDNETVTTHQKLIIELDA